MTMRPSVKLSASILFLISAFAPAAHNPGESSDESVSTRPQSQDRWQWEEVWKRYPSLRAEHEAAWAGFEDWLRSLEPEAFAAQYGVLGQQTQSEDSAQRIRAIRAVAALHEFSGLPYLVRATESPDREVRAWAFSGLVSWVNDDYHAGDRTVPQSLKPLLPFFVRELVEAAQRGDTNAMASCFHPIGCLAGAEWLPLVKEAAPTLHPLQTYFAQWCVEQITSRSGSGAATQATSRPAETIRSKLPGVPSTGSVEE